MKEEYPLKLSAIEELYYYGAEKALSIIKNSKTTKPHSENKNEQSIIKIPDNEIWYTSYDGKIVIPNKNEENFLTGKKLLKNTYENNIGKFIFENDITFIQHHAFSNCKNLKTIIIPSSIKEIHSSCFSKSGLQEVIFSENSKLINLYSCAFYFCNNLKKITIPSVVTIGCYADGNTLYGNTFNGCTELEEIVIGENCTELKGSEFIRCSNLKTLKFLSLTAPKLDSYVMFFETNNNSKFNFTGKNVLQEEKLLLINNKSVGYYDGIWADCLVNECGYNIVTF